MCRISFNRRKTRKGVATVEFALTVPILFMLLFASFEFSRAYVIFQTCEIAAAEGARQGIVPGSTAADCRDAASAELSRIGVSNFTVSVSPSVFGSGTKEVTVTAQVPIDLKNGYVVPRFFMGRILSKTVTLPREQAPQ